MIDTMIEQFAVHLARQRGQSPAELRPYVRWLIAQAQHEYAAAGAPYGATEAGFVRWLVMRPRLVRSA